jgi:hypothetical protein
VVLLDVEVPFTAGLRLKMAMMDDTMNAGTVFHFSGFLASPLYVSPQPKGVTVLQEVYISQKWIIVNWLSIK